MTSIHDLLTATLSQLGLPAPGNLIESLLLKDRYLVGHKFNYDGGYAVMRADGSTEEAREQIRRGHLTLYTFGLRDFDRSYDPTTGLPLEGIAGCVVDESTLRRAREHNEYVKNWIRRGNTPPNSLLPYNRLIADPFSQIPASSFVPLTPQKPAKLANLEVTYAIIREVTGSAYHTITVKSSSANWSNPVFIGNAARLGIALVADGRVVAITTSADDKEALGKSYQSITLFDRPTGISLNHVAKKGGKEATRQRPF